MTETGNQLRKALNQLADDGHLPDIANEPHERANELGKLLSRIFKLVDELDDNYEALRTHVLDKRKRRNLDEAMGIDTIRSDSGLVTGIRTWGGVYEQE